jgi:arylsulfatase A-like enzyme
MRPARRPSPIVALFLLVIGLVSAAAQRQGKQPKRRNVIIFVADGLRHGSVNAQDTPALWAARVNGVHFRNSHSLFPTFTMANASAIATGHLLGDTGVFSNTVWVGHPTFDTGNFRLPAGTAVPFLENDQVQADLVAHHEGNYLGEDTLLALARSHGYNTAAIGKLGPAGLQNVAGMAPVDGVFSTASPAVIVDDLTGAPSGVPLPRPLQLELQNAKLPLEAPTRSNGYGPQSPYNNGYSGDRVTAGTKMANVVQQQWLIDVTTRAVLPWFERDNKPFAIVFWSRDPDGTQHNQGDSLDALSPGINGTTSQLSLRNADRCLQQLFSWLDAHPAIKANTDIFVTSDHGFATISRREIDPSGRTTTSDSAQHDYLDAQGGVETARGTLPYGFLAIDLALDLRLNLFDPDRRAAAGDGVPYPRLRLGPAVWEHPLIGNGFIGAEIHRPDGSDATAIVAANGGSDLIYVPGGSTDIVRTIVSRLLSYDYVSGVFVDDTFGDIPGTLPISVVGLVGASRLPRPAIVVAFKVFYRDPNDLQTAVQVSDAVLREGQGMHGGFGRDSTYNNMAAIGPDFKRHFVDEAPASNADIAPTLASVMGFDLKGNGVLRGRVLREALSGERSTPPSPTKHLLSASASGARTLLFYRELNGAKYPESACLVFTELVTPTACQ